MSGDHDHVWGAVKTALMTGNPHRRCTVEGCGFITLDLSDECDCGDYDNCKSCGLWAESMLADGCSPYNGMPCDPDELRDVETRVWNGALAAGDPDRIERVRDIILTNSARRIMDDDPNYAAAGYRPGQ